MRRRQLFLALFCLVCFAFSGHALAAKKSKSLLKGVGKQKAKQPSMSLLLREDIRDAFKEIMTDYLAEDLEGFVGSFSNTVMSGRQALNGKRPKISQKQLRKRIKREFKQQNFKKVKFKEVFNVASPSMCFVINYTQLKEKIPVWNFGVSPKEIWPLMKPGDYLIIANTEPDFDKVNLPLTMYLIFREVGEELVAVGLF